jgi:NADPH:quinone reductase-like Zn-dependent oxidoreductase
MNPAKHARYAYRGRVPHEVIKTHEFTLLPPLPNEARVAVLAAPVNPSDVLQLTGEYGQLPPLPAVGGNEGVGRVEEINGEAHGLEEGDIVLLPVGCGSWSTHLNLPTRELVKLPHDVDPVQLAMLSVNPPTASLLLSDIVELQPGDWVIQNAANSAVGGYVAQIARRRGIHVLNVVRRESAIEAVWQAGGEHVLVDAEDLPDRVRDAVGEIRVRLALDCVGGVHTEHLARCLGPGGTIVNYGAMSGERCMVSPRYLVFNGLSLRGFWLAHWFRKARPERRQALFAELAAMVADGGLHANVQASYGIDHVREAVQAASAGARHGKIVIEPNGPSRAAL